jgi:3-deoxy-manno-octulosonate cytidylyltransferase (CMP-KDO synthetase)
MLNKVLIIPARMNSSRFPGKPLKKINGIPMIGHCYYRSIMSELVDDVYVATCDDTIKEYIKSIGGKVIMTSKSHERASDRVSEAMLKIEKLTNKKIDIVILYQGDEPMVKPEMIDHAIRPILKGSGIEVINLMTKITSNEEFEDPNEVKVVIDNNYDALYFSREPIPSSKKYTHQIIKYKQVCIIPFLRDSLIKFNEIPQTTLEIIESIDMLRLIESGHKVKMVEIEDQVFSVDTEDDLNKVEKLMVDDNLIKFYGK